jgi:predicted DNA-binding transcriptional regulator YafY
VRGYKMPPLVFSPEEAVAVHLGTGLVKALWGRLYAEAAQSALAKLDNLLPDEQRQEVAWASRSLVAAGLHRSGLDALADTLESLRQAVREHRQVSMHYQGQAQTAVHQRILDPYALVHSWGWWYVVGFCHLRKALRTFRLDRIQELHLLDQSFEMPEEFNIHAYLERQQVAQPGFPVRLHFSVQAARQAREYATGWEAVEEQPDGSLIVTMRTPDLNWAASTVLAYGPLVQVLEPPELRDLVHEWALAVIDQYSKKDEEHGG